MPEEQPFGEASTSFFGGASTIGSSSTSYSALAPSRGADATSPAATGGAGDYNGGYTSGGSLSPVARQDSFTAATGRTGEQTKEMLEGCVVARQAGLHAAGSRFIRCARSYPLPNGVPTSLEVHEARMPRLPHPTADSMWASRPLRADSSLAQRPASDSYYPEELPAASSPTGGGGGSLWRQASNAPGSAGPRSAGWGCSGLCNKGVAMCSVQPRRPAARHSCVPCIHVCGVPRRCWLAAAFTLTPSHLPLPVAPRTRAPIAAPLAQLAAEGWAAA